MQPTMSFGFCAVPALLLCLMLPALAGGQEVGGNLLPDGFYINCYRRARLNFPGSAHRAAP